MKVYASDIYENASKFVKSSKEARKLKGYKCELCGKKGNIAHHIDKKKHNHELSNLLVVCQDCHSALHRTKSPCPNCKCKHWKIYVKSGNTTFRYRNRK